MTNNKLQCNKIENHKKQKKRKKTKQKKTEQKKQNKLCDNLHWRYYYMSTIYHYY